MRNLASWSVRQRRWVVAIWLSVLNRPERDHQSVGSSYKDSFSLNGHRASPR